jgi:uncharacterized membrane protein YfcA
MANTTFSGPVTSTAGFIGDITGDVVGLVQVPTYTVANAPSAAAAGAGALVYVSNGAAGAAILAFSNGTDWKRSDTGATIAAA